MQFTETDSDPYLPNSNSGDRPPPLPLSVLWWWVSVMSEFQHPIPFLISARLPPFCPPPRSKRWKSFTHAPTLASRMQASHPPSDSQKLLLRPCIYSSCQDRGSFRVHLLWHDLKPGRLWFLSVPQAGCLPSASEAFVLGNGWNKAIPAILTSIFEQLARASMV